MRMDVDALLAALEAPVVKIGGVEYTCRHPTFLERLEIDKRWSETDWNDPTAQRETTEYICSMVNIPADVVLALPEAVLTEVVGFFLILSRGRNLRSPEPSES